MRDSNPLAWIEAARTGGYAVGAFNMHNDETTQALLQAAELSNSPIYLQVGRAIIPHMGLRKAYELTVRNAEESDALYTIHLDHGTWDEVLLAVRLGFDSIMFDAAHLPFEENIKATRRAVELCHDYGIPVEAELGKIPGRGRTGDWKSYYTDVHEAERFVAETGVDLLAISAGVVHGVMPGIRAAAVGHRPHRRDPRRRSGPAGAARRLGCARERDQGGHRERRPQTQRRHRPAARVPGRGRGGWTEGDRQLEYAWTRDVAAWSTRR